MSPSHRRRRDVAHLSAALLIAVCVSHEPLRAQGMRTYGELPVAGGASTSSLSQLGKIAVYDDGQSIYAWSSHVRRWVGLRKPANAFVRQANDWVLVQGAQSFSAFSSMRGVWETKQLSVRASVVNPAVQRNDSILLVRDGAKVHGFSGFVGTWSEQSLSMSAQIVVQRHAAIAVDGTTLWGLGAFDMRWRAQSIAGTASHLWADSFGAVAEAGSTLYGYSAQTRRWSSIRRTGSNPMRVRHGDVALWYGAPTVVAWSALRGSFASQIVGTGPVVLEADRQVGVASNASGTFFFSAPLGSWLRTAVPSTALRNLDSTCVLVTEPTRYHAYSALRGTLTTVAERSSNPQTSRSMAAVVDAAGKPRLYSSLTGRWQTPPSNAVAKPALLVAHAGLVETSTGVAAMSARTGRFVPLAARGVSALANPATSILAVLESNRLSVFDARSETWLQRSRGASSPSPSVWRTVLLAVDGTSLVGFGSQAGRLEVQDLSQDPGPYVLRSSSEVATALHPKGVWAYSPTPDLLTAAQFPEFRRVWTLGNALPVFVSAAPQSIVVPIVGAREQSPLSTPFGALEVSLSSLVFGMPVTVSSASSASFEIQVPNDVSLRGVEVAWQGIVLTRNPVSAYLTRSASTRLQ